MSTYNKKFWKAAGDRAFRSLAQGLLVTGVGGVGILEINWVAAISLAVGYALATLTTSFSALVHAISLFDDTPAETILVKTDAKA